VRIVADQALPGLVRPAQHGILIDFMALGAQAPIDGGQGYGGFAIRRHGVMAVLTAQLDCLMDKFPLVLSGMALEAGFSLEVRCFKIRVIGGFKISVIHGVGSRKFANLQSANGRCNEKE
jgi:hypothetical protein